jgi:hypothetical protein
MELVFINCEVTIEALSEERCDSPEDFIERLESALESGEMTIDEVMNFLADYERRQR